MLAVGPPLHRHGDRASQQFVAAGLAPPVADQKGVYLGDWGVCQTPRACAGRPSSPRPWKAGPSPARLPLPPLPTSLGPGKGTSGSLLSLVKHSQENSPRPHSALPATPRELAASGFCFPLTFSFVHSPRPPPSLLPSSPPSLPQACHSCIYNQFHSLSPSHSPACGQTGTQPPHPQEGLVTSPLISFTLHLHLGLSSLSPTFPWASPRLPLGVVTLTPTPSRS